jgi:Icc-related predicted phosphoesterase
VKIAYLVDVHDRFDAVEQALARIGDVDVLVVGGDITTGGSAEDAERALERWRTLAPTLLAVAGNMDSAAIDARLVELGYSLDGRGVVLGDVGIGGVSAGPPTPLHTPHELPDDELGRRGDAALAQIAGCRVRLFCPHAPPHGTTCDAIRSGEHVGSHALRVLVEREQPDVVLCGHIHEARGEDTIGASRVVNPGPAFAGHYAVVEVGEDVTVRLD